MLKFYFINILIFLFFDVMSINDSLETITDTQKIEIKCLSVFRIKTSYVIEHNQEYRQMLNESNAKESFGNLVQECNDYKLPEIDFSKRTLLGFHTMATGCKRPENYKVQILLDEKNKKYLVVVGIEEIFGCLPLWEKTHFYTVPKLKKDYTVEFRTATTVRHSFKEITTCDSIENAGSGEFIGNYLIKTEEELKNLEKITGCDFSEIDIKHSVLLGMKTTNKSCSEPVYEREFISHKEGKKFYYNINIKSLGNCEKEYFSMNWIVLNLPGYKDLIQEVEFISNDKKNE